MHPYANSLISYGLQQQALRIAAWAWLSGQPVSVGSVIAMMLPLPIIWLDDSLSYGAQLSATLVPVLIQGYVGNFLVR
jgi:hypothetical protein